MRRDFQIAAAVFESTGSPIEKLKFTRVSVQHPQSLTSKDKTLLIKTVFAPINPSDLFQIHGFYPSFPKKHDGYPFLAGNEGVYQVVESDDDRFQKGQYVLPSILCFGTWRSAAYVNSNDVIALPPRPANSKLSLKDELVASSMLSVNLCTAYRLLKDFGNLKDGDIVVQNGSNSGVGRAVIQLCKLWNLKVVGTIRARKSEEETNALKEELVKLGATRILTEEEFEQNKDIQDARLALNCVAGKSAQNQFKALGSDAYHVTYGGMSSEPFNAPVGALIFKNVKIVGFWVSQWKEKAQKDNRSEFDHMISELTELLLDGKLESPPVQLVDLTVPDIEAQISDDQLAQYQERLIKAVNWSQEQHSKGKVVLQFSNLE